MILHKLKNNQYKQILLFKERDIQVEFNMERLNNLIDNINRKYRRDTLDWGSSTIEKDWNPRRKQLSYLKTTTIDSIPTVFAN